MFFLYHRTTRPTGEVLGRALGIPHGTHAPQDRQDVVIRWGSRDPLQYRPSLFTLNPSNAIGRATDKLASLERMRERGVIVPPFSTNPRELRFPVLGRNINHTRGTDIVFALQLRDVQGGSDFYTQYVPTAREYRARVVGEECVRVSEKVLTDPDAYCPWIRNYENGYTFRSPSVRLNAYQEALAVSAVKAHGLDFGAVDLVVGDDGHTYVLEVNTAPALAPRSAAAMLGGIVRLIQERADITLDPDFAILNALSGSDDGLDFERSEFGDGDTEDDRDDFIDF